MIAVLAVLMMMAFSFSEDYSSYMAPAYAEVDCVTGGYTGWRYRFEGQELLRVPLYNNAVPTPTGFRNFFGTMGRCIYG